MKLKVIVSILGALFVWSSFPGIADAGAHPAPNITQAEARLRKVWSNLHPKEKVAKVQSHEPGRVTSEVRDGARVTTATYVFQVTVREPQSHLFEVALKLVFTDAGWAYDSLEQLGDSDVAGAGQKPPTRAAVKTLVLAELNKSQPNGFNMTTYAVPAKFDKVLVSDPQFKIFRDTDTWGFTYVADFETVAADGQRLAQARVSQ